MVEYLDRALLSEDANSQGPDGGSAIEAGGLRERLVSRVSIRGPHDRSAFRTKRVCGPAPYSIETTPVLPL